MLSILLVDDEPAILDIAKLFLEKTGTISAVTVSSARDAILLLKEQSFDAIVSDYEMPEMNGVQFLRELRIHGDHTPFIIFTGKGREQIVVEALNAGATFYLEKGANPRALFSELHNQIHQAVNRRIAESALKESEEKYRALIEHGLEGIAILDLKGKILFANRAAARTFEIENIASLIGRNVFEFLAPDSKAAVDKDFDTVARGTDAYLAVYRCLTARGKEIWIDSIGRRIMYEGSPADLVSIRNITQLKQATERLEVLNNKLKLVSSVMRHDIRNKITAVSGYTELAKTTTRDPAILEYLQKQEPLLDEILEELEFIHDYEKIGDVVPSWQDLDTLILSFLPFLQKHGISLDHSVKGFFVYADPLLERVFSNLIDNSLRHGGKVSIIRIGIKKQDTSLLLSYEDDGTGIPADQKTRIFEKGIGTNTGLGLFLIREILAITRITITETGEPGKGVRFEVLVPEGVYKNYGKNDHKVDHFKAFSNLRILTFLFIFFIFLIFGTTVLVISTQTRENIITLTRSDVQSDAAIAALQIDGDTLASLRPGDEQDPSFLAIRDQLNAIRKTDEKIRYIYTMRKSDSGVEFIVDGDYGQTSDAAHIGKPYPNLNPELLEGFEKPTSNPGFTSDAWGILLSGYAPVRNSRGDVIGIIGVDMDQKVVVDRLNYLNGIFFLLAMLSILAAVIAIIVIERRRSLDEEVMLANRLYLTQIFESVRAGILIIDARTHRIIDANPSALVMIGISREQVIGKVCHSFVCPAGLGKCPITDMGQTVDNSERVLLTAGGACIPIIKYVVPLVVDGRPCLLETFVDISDRKKAEDSLVSAIRKLKVLSVVTRNDIITDIYALEGYIELICDDIPAMQTHPLSQKIDWVMERIRLKSAFFKDYDESGTLEPVWQEVAFSVQAAKERLRTSRLSVTVDVGALEIFADPLLGKVFSHLLDNTLNHGKHATEVRITLYVSEKTLVLVYEDNGVGITAGEKERIFERGVGSITGLGLFFAREVLALTGITIRECGEPGTGVRFEMYVPEGKYRMGSASVLDQPPEP